MRFFHRIPVVAVLLWGCATTRPAQQASGTAPAADPAIAYLGSVPVYRSEFLYVYEKNGGITDTLSQAKGVRSYLDLYLNFRLKVQEAESLGLDTLASFRQELAGYRDQLAEPYLTDSSVIRTLVREAYEHMKEEIRAAHILLPVSEEAPPEDTLRVFNQITDIRRQALSGQDFTTLARQYSQDPSAQANGGDLGYFTALQMVYPFEKAAYQTAVGSVSAPVRTKFGYHLLKVADRRPSRGKVTVAHIMVRTNPEAPEAEARAARQKIEELSKRLKQGENWDKLCTDFSEDGNSRAKGGVLPAFGTGSTLPEFENAAFALANAGDVGQPFQTPYGWHILKLVERKNLETFTQLEPTLRQKVAKDSRSELNRTLLLQRLRRENQLVENAPVRQQALAQASDSLRLATWSYNPSDKLLAQPLFTLKGQPHAVRDFFDFVKSHQQPREKLTPAYQMQRLYDEYVNEELVRHEKANLERKYPDFKYLMKEYHDGILLFQRMETEVWAKSLTDTTGQRQYFARNAQAYQWPQRVAATVYNAADNTVLAEVKARLAARPFAVPGSKYPDLAFAKNTATLTPPQQQQLDQVFEALQQDKALVLEIAGHAARAEKPGLAAARTRTVSSYLTRKGLDLTRLVIRDFGTTAPLSRTDARRNSRAALALFSTDKKVLERQLNSRKPLSVEITEGLFQKGDHPLVDKAPWQVGTHTMAHNGRVVMVEVAGVEAPRPKTYEEARGQVVTDYQNYLEQEWLAALRTRFPVRIVEPEVEKLEARK